LREYGGHKFDIDGFFRLQRMMNNSSYLTYRIIDKLSKKSSMIIDRLKSNDEDHQYSQIYLTYDQKDKLKTKYILRLIDLEYLSNLTEFLVC